MDEDVAIAQAELRRELLVARYHARNGRWQAVLAGQVGGAVVAAGATLAGQLGIAVGLAGTLVFALAAAFVHRHLVRTEDALMRAGFQVLEDLERLKRRR